MKKSKLKYIAQCCITAHNGFSVTIDTSPQETALDASNLAHGICQRCFESTGRNVYDIRRINSFVTKLPG